MTKLSWRSALVPSLLVLALVAFPLTRPSTYLLGFLFLTFMYVALASSWNILGGFGGYLGFGHVAFFGIGAYTTALLLLHLGWSPFLTAPLAGLVAGVFAAVVGYPCLRLRGPYFSLITMILALAVHTVVLNVSWTNGSNGLFLPFLEVDIFTNRLIFYEAMLVLALLSVLILRRVERSKMGIGLTAIRADEEVAQTLGVDATRLKIQAFALGAFLAGMVGGIYAYYQTYLHPDFVFQTGMSVIIVLMALFGGRLSWKGPMVGASILSVVSEVLTIKIGAETARIVYGTLLIIVIIFLPNGLMASTISLDKLTRVFRRKREQEV